MPFVIIPRIYGLTMSLALLVTVGVALIRVKEDRKNPVILLDLAIISLVFGIVGARLYHVIHRWDFYSAEPMMILHIWNGGLGIFGFLIGAFFGWAAYSAVKRIPVMPYIVYLMSTLPLGQAIGRWGNFFLSEAYGLPTRLPWGQYIPIPKRYPGYEMVDRYHPIFLYESILNLVLFYILTRMWYREKPPRSGRIIYSYLIGYGIIRFGIEFLRLGKWSVGTVGTAHIMSLISIAAGVWGWNSLRSTR